jgi:hypothetical protein
MADPIRPDLSFWLDFDHDGQLDAGTPSDDPLNLIPTPVTWASIDFSEDASTVTLNDETTLYGQKVANVVCTSDTTAGIYVGRDSGGTVDDIAASPSTAYRFTFWIRGLANWSGVNFRVIAHNQAGDLLTSTTVGAITDGWKQVSIAVTTNSTTTHLRFNIIKNVNAALTEFDATGFMLTSSYTTPTQWNDGTRDEGDDISAYVIDASWNYGMEQPYQHNAGEPVLRLTLKNADRRFSPEDTDGPHYGRLKPGRLLVVYDETNARRLWTGRVRSITPTMGQYLGPYRSVVEGSGPKWLLEAAEIDIDLLENVTSDEVIAEVLSKVENPPSFARAWRLGETGFSELGETTYLADTELPSSLETGLSTWAYVGDNFDRFTTAYGAIANAVNAERGRFFFDRDGTATFWNRAKFQVNLTVVATITDTMASLDYGFGDDILNDARVIASPRALSATNGETLWTLDEPLTLRPGEAREMRARYVSGEGQQIAGRNVQTPSTGASTLTFSKGTATLSSFVAESRSASFTLTNDSASKECIVSAITILGQKITSWNAQELRHQDQVSISEFGRYGVTVNEPLIADPGYALNVAQYLVMQRAQPRGAVRSFVLQARDATNLNLLLTLDVGDRIALAETQTGHSGEYFIVGARYEWRESGTRFSAAYTVEPAASYVAWVLGEAGRSELGETTYLGL